MKAKTLSVVPGQHFEFILPVLSQIGQGYFLGRHALRHLPLQASVVESQSSLPMGFFGKTYKRQINKQKEGKRHTEQPDEVPLEIK